MIRSKDRSYYIGASDTSFVVGNWNTKNFERWYATKQGFYSMDYTNDYMRAGTHFEHRILDALEIKGLRKDEQIIDGRLRINLDGCTDYAIYEVKTHSIDKPFKVTKAYRQQVIVEMFAAEIRNAQIVAYGLEAADYKNFYRDIDTSRLTFHPIEYDREFIEQVYLPRFCYLAACLERGAFPKENELVEQWSELLHK